MSKRCAKCEKSVYPIEELKCLDKIWHKTCFKCEVCGMTLNMKNYKGFDKKPYCNAHYPTQKFTAVADTPEMNRLAQNTKIQSNLKYHEDFEKQKGKFTQVADDPETLRLMQNSQTFSSIKYHEDFEKNIKGTKIQVDNDPETQRVMEHSKVISQVEYKGLKAQQQDQEARRGNIPADNEPTQLSRRSSDYDPAGGDHQPSPYSAKFQGQSTMYTSGGQKVEQQRNRRVGSINDYDPMNENWGSAAPGQHAQYTGGSTHGQQWEEQVQLPRHNHSGASQPQYYPAPAQQPKQQAYQPPAPQQPAYQPPPPQPVQPAYQPPAPAPAPARRGPVYSAMYDYDAQDDDEVGFRDGDLIVDIEPIDEGWMIGTVERSGQRGMLPANYVEKVSG